jgi:hypothetical protein
MTMREKFEIWAFGAALIVGLPLAMFAAQRITG